MKRIIIFLLLLSGCNEVCDKKKQEETFLKCIERSNGGSWAIDNCGMYARDLHCGPKEKSQ
jgi:hypothetical protein